ncbi:hypothetical protein ES703_125726 [subsurface metagenome]
MPAVYQALAITAITVDSGTAGGPAAPDWANGTAGITAEAAGTRTNKVTVNLEKRIWCHKNSLLFLRMKFDTHFNSFTPHLSEYQVLAQF